MLLAIYDGKKYAAEIAEFMYEATNGAFQVKEQSLYRALRRFTSMKLVSTSEEDSPNAGPKRKFYTLTPAGEEVLTRFVGLHVAPLFSSRIQELITSLHNERN